MENPYSQPQPLIEDPQQQYQKSTTPEKQYSEPHQTPPISFPEHSDNNNTVKSNISNQQQQQQLRISNNNRIKEPIFSPQRNLSNEKSQHLHISQQQQPNRINLHQSNLPQQQQSIIMHPINTQNPQLTIQRTPIIQPQQQFQKQQQPSHIIIRSPSQNNQQYTNNIVLGQQQQQQPTIKTTTTIRRNVIPFQQQQEQQQQINIQQQPQQQINNNNNNNSIDNIELIRTQANRIQHLEDRIEVITGEFKRQKGDLEFRTKEVDSWQSGYETLQTQLNLHMERVREQDQNIAQMKEEHEKVILACETRETELKDLQSQLKERAQEATFWRKKANDSEENVEIIQKQENRIQILELENKRLNQQIQSQQDVIQKLHTDNINFQQQMSQIQSQQSQQQQTQFIKMEPLPINTTTATVINRNVIPQPQYYQQQQISPSFYQQNTQQIQQQQPSIQLHEQLHNTSQQQQVPPTLNHNLSRNIVDTNGSQQKQQLTSPLRQATSSNFYYQY